jgi:hypothetical protein
MKILEKDSTLFGFTISIMLPLIIFLAVYFFKFYDSEYSSIWWIPQIGKKIPKIVSLCIFPNGLIFYLYILKNKLKTMKGMLSGTMILALFVGVLFFIF